MRRNKKIDLFCILIIAAALAAVVLFNIFQTNRPTVSEEEKRELATLPSLSVDSVTDGSYFKQFDSFFTDTFLAREKLINLSTGAKLLYGFSLGDGFTIIDGDTGRDNPDETELIIPDIETETDIETESETETETEKENETYPDVSSMKFENEVIYLKTGESSVLNLVFEPEIPAGSLPVVFSSSNRSIVAVTRTDGLCHATARKAGTATVYASAPNGMSCQAIVHISNPGETTNNVPIYADEPDFLSNGFVIYKDAVYASPYYVESGAKSFGNVVNKYAELFPNSRVSVIIAPLSSYKLDLDLFGKGRLRDQNDIIEKDGQWYSEKVTLVNPFSYLMAHKDEYLYFRSDHHWTSRGAYYAYQAFCDKRGLIPTPLESMEEIVLSDSWRGSMYLYTKDERVRAITDVVYAYMPTKEHTMTVYQEVNTLKYNSCIVTANHNYIAFLTGDRPYTVINVPSNPQDFNCLVFKDSYGNAFVPYLCEHYGNIIVVDPRKCNYNIYNMLKDYPLSDIIFMNNIYNPNNSAWARMLLERIS